MIENESSGPGTSGDTPASSSGQTAGTAGAQSPSVAPSEDDAGREASAWVRIGVSIGVVAVGVLGMGALVMLKKDPAEAKISERTISVETIEVAPENVPVTVTGLGEARALNVVPVSPEIPGTVVEIHPRLEMGEVIPAGELLFRIDPRDYNAARDQAQAQVEQMSKTVERLQRQASIDEARLATLRRNEDLMEEEFNRMKTLFEEDEVGTRSAVDHAEMAFNQATDAKDQLGQAVSLYPVRIQEAQSGLEAARAQLAQAVANLARTEIRTDFDARIKQVSLEAGQYVNPGAQVLTLADDRVLEVSVSLDSRDARDWLLFDEQRNTGGEKSWFGDLKPVTCQVAWTEAPDDHTWEGKVHRVEAFDANTRTVTVAVRVTAEAARQSTGGLPLVDGMFCSVAIPGRSMEQVYRLPRWAVSYEGNVYVSRDEHLAIQAVEVVRSEGEESFVRGGLSPGDEVITTRLSNPLPGDRVSVSNTAKAAS